MGNQNSGPTVSTRAALSFADALGNKGGFSVPRADAGLTEAKARAAMAAMIATGALELKGMDPPAAALKAKLVTTTRTVVDGI